MTLGLTPRQADLLKGTAGFVEGRVAEDSIFAVLYRECHVLFPDVLFADLFDTRGRRSVPLRIVAVVMVLQRLCGLSDRDAVAAFEFDVRDGRRLDATVVEVGELLATVLGQDLEADDEGRFVIARRVAKDRIISTVDPDARHGHKTAARGFDGYKGHVAVDPTRRSSRTLPSPRATPVMPRSPPTSSPTSPTQDDSNEGEGEETIVYGENAYATGEFHDYLEDSDITSRCKTQQPVNRAGRYPKNAFHIDLDAGTVTWPAEGHRVDCRNRKGDGIAPAKATRPGRPTTKAPDPKSNANSPTSCADSTADAAARVRGKPKVDADFNLLAAATDLARLAALGITSTPTGWTPTAS